MGFEKWVEGCKVRVFPWIDGLHYYVNVQYFTPGSSVEKPPAWEKTVYVTKYDKGEDVIRNFLSSLVQYICGLPKGKETVILTL